MQIRFVLVEPLKGIDYGIQKGKGKDYETIDRQRSTGRDLPLSFTVPVTQKNGAPNFTGPIAQGPPAARFVYVDVGRYAGQSGTDHGARMKVPLGELTWKQVKEAMSQGRCVEARLPGEQTAMTPPLDGWTVVG